uniref:NADH dehydrogenase subunit 6 n=1 Tax=Nodularia douglasiae TaxID=1830228 RepID=A0A2K8C416_9BIVA|nr:NADH dehydrogenase subunit 6 [Nodularia douglasiae]
MVSMMTLILFTSMMVFFLLSSMTCTHPLILAMKILLLALSLCSSINLLTTWYAYMIFMVMLGGVLIMFTYISSLAPNSIFKVKWNTVHVTVQLAILMFLTFNLMNSYPKVFSTQKPDSLPNNLITFFLLESNSWLLLTMASALFLAMFIVTNLLSGAKSAMRPTKQNSLSSKQENKIIE